MRKKITMGAVLLFLAGMGWIGMDRYYSYCAGNPSDPACPTISPTPSPSPTAEPTPSPSPSPTASPTPIATPTPVPTPIPTPSPTAPPTTSACPKKLAAGAYPYLNNKRYGNGIDATVRVHGDQEFCYLIHKVNTNDCHLEGWAQRSECEMELIGGCPIWQYTKNDTVFTCHQAPHPDQSCDHFGDPVYRDDPQTPDIFEGRPAECGLQRDSAGDPMAGFFIIAHGAYLTRACLPDGTNCGPWIFGKDGQ